MKTKCNQCNKRNTRYIEERTRKSGKVTAIYYCEICKREFWTQKSGFNRVSQVKILCPHCKTDSLMKDGKYFTKSRPHYRQIYRCNRCRKATTFRKALSHKKL